MALIDSSVFYIIFSCICLVTTTSVPYKTMSSGYRIPIFGYGTFTVTNETELTIALNEALEAGYRHIDTAQYYQNEHIIGNVLTEWLSSGRIKREDLFVTTKVHFAKAFPDQVGTTMKTSLDKLKLNYVDLLLIHFPISFNEDGNGGLIPVPTDHIGVWKKMEEQVDAGLVKSIGLSNFNVSQIDRIRAVARIQPSNLQIEIHPYSQQKEIRDYCKQHNIVVVAYGPLGAPGLMTFFKVVGWKEQPLPAILNDPDIVRIAKKHNKSPAQVTLRFLIQLDLIPIPKSTNAERIKENFDVFDFELDDKDMMDMEKLDKGIEGKIFHFKFFAPYIDQHPEYPFTELIEKK